MKPIALFFSLFWIASFAQASQTFGRSAYRAPGRSYLTYMQESKRPESTELLGHTPSDLAVAYGKAQLPAATNWESLEVMNQRFAYFRDLRWINDPSRKDFLRRSSWLYPDDGCFARAALAVRDLALQKISLPDKIFVFGDLQVQTPNAPTGSVTWWYHVAPIVEVAGKKYVLDPAVEARRPLELGDWLARLSSDPQNVEVALCSSGAYDPDDDCAHQSDGVELKAQNDQPDYLNLEWNRLIELHRDPTAELGDQPPWK